MTSGSSAGIGVAARCASVAISACTLFERVSKYCFTHALAAVTSVGYTGFLAGPPLIGLVAQVTSLRIALGIVAALGALITALAPAVRGDGEALSPG